MFYQDMEWDGPLMLPPIDDPRNLVEYTLQNAFAEVRRQVLRADCQ